MKDIKDMYNFFKEQYSSSSPESSQKIRNEAVDYVRTGEEHETHFRCR